MANTLLAFATVFVILFVVFSEMIVHQLAKRGISINLSIRKSPVGSNY